MVNPTGNSSTLGGAPALTTQFGNVVRIPITFTPSQNVQNVNVDISAYNLQNATSALLDNSTNSFPTTFYFQQTGQNVTVPPNQQQIVSLLLTGKYISISATTTIGTALTVNVFLAGGKVFPAVWQSSPPISGPLVYSYLVLTASGSLTVPANWNSSVNLIEVYGAGSDGLIGTNGGAGGSYASISNYVATPGAIIPYQIGVRGGSVGAGTVPTSNTWFKDGATLLATGSNGQVASGIVNCVGTVKFGGGNGGNSTGAAGGGGGGAGGPNGVGAAGGIAAGSVGGAGGTADLGLGGAGGAGGTQSPTRNGVAGGFGTETNGTWGAGGGGGGGAQGGGSSGANGGQYGGGGGGNGYNQYLGVGSSGALILSWAHS